MTGLEWIALGVSSLATSSVVATSLYVGTYLAAIGGAAFLGGLLQPKPDVPKPEDGAYNLKQPVPTLSFVLGTVKKGGDYLFLEQADGVAYHIIDWAGHEIDGFVEHYLHDELVTLDVDGYVVEPAHWVREGSLKYVNIDTRLGLAASTAYADVIAAFPTIYSADFRGDGLATVRMSCKSVAVKYYPRIYPNQMPQHTAIGRGMKLYDPRTETRAFSRNLALMRLWHMISPVGGKMSLDDVYLPDWINAADVCDRTIINRDGVAEPLYHGGFWFRANNDPVAVGLTMDQAAEMVVYERSDGLVGVHAGEYVPPTIVLTADDIVEITHDVNKRKASDILAVRGRWTNPQNRYATADAAIWGDPYVGDDSELSMTIDNLAVQSNNHIQRLQKLAYLRRKGARVSLVVQYKKSTKDIRRSRFVGIQLPPRLANAVLEITETPKVSLRNMTISFTAIVMPADFYAFDSATEEGAPPPTVLRLVDQEVPDPKNPVFTVKVESVGGGGKVVYVLATWDHDNDDFTYEVEWHATSGDDQEPRSVVSQPGDDQVRTPYLRDGQQYSFHIRTWAFGSPGEWGDDVLLTPHADETVPLALASFTLTGSAPRLGNASFQLVTANDLHLFSVGLFRKASGTPLDLSVDLPFVTLAAPASSTFGYVDGDATRANLITDGDFATGPGPWTLGTGWSIGSGKATKAAGTGSSIFETVTLTPVGTVFRHQYEASGVSAGNIQPRLLSGTTVSGTAQSADGTYRGKLTSVFGNTAFGLFGSNTFVGSVDNVVLFAETGACAPQGAWDYYAVPFNSSAFPGPASGPLAVTII